MHPAPLSSLWLTLSPAEDTPAWAHAADATDAARLKDQARAREQALLAALPGLRAVPLTRDDVEAMADGDGDDDDAPQDIAPLIDRHAVLRGRWAGGEVVLRLSDGLLEAELEVGDATAARPALVPLMQRLADATGWSRWGPAPAGQAAIGPVADAAWQRHHRLAANQQRATRRLRRLQAAGPAAAALLTVAAWGLAALLVAQGVQQVRLAQAVQSGPQATFVTQRLVGPAPGLNVTQRHVLAGRVEPPGAEVRLEVSRAAYLRAAPGARHAVVATTDPARPWVLAHEAAAGDGGWGLALAALLPLGFWGTGVAWPLLRGPRPGVWAVMTRRALSGAALVAVMAAAWWLRTR